MAGQVSGGIDKTVDLNTHLRLLPFYLLAIKKERKCGWINFDDYLENVLFRRLKSVLNLGAEDIIVNITL